MERLKKPGKITIVYQDADVKSGYLHLTSVLQEEIILTENLKILHTEDGSIDVFGFIAIRVAFKNHYKYRLLRDKDGKLVNY